MLVHPRVVLGGDGRVGFGGVAVERRQQSGPGFLHGRIEEPLLELVVDVAPCPEHLVLDRGEGMGPVAVRLGDLVGAHEI